MENGQDPEDYSIFGDLLIIMGALVVVGGLLTAVGYGAWSLFGAAGETFSDLAEDEGLDGSTVQELQEQIQQTFEEAIGKEPEPPPAPTSAPIRFEPFEALASKNGSWKIYGELVNESPFSVSAPLVELAFRGADGSVVDTQSVRPQLFALASGESRPIAIDVRSRNGSSAFEVLSASATPGEPLPRFDAVEVTLDQRRARKGTAVLKGTVTNRGKAIAFDVTVDVVAYRDKAQTQPIGVSTAFIGAPLGPGERRSFETKPMLLKRRAVKLSPRVRAYAQPVN